MKVRSNMHFSRLAVAGTLLVAGAVNVWAHAGATGVVKERMHGMMSISDGMKVIARMLKGSEPYDGAKVSDAAAAIAALGGDALTKGFPEGSLQNPSEASPQIWTDWERFSGYARDMQTSASDLQQLAEADAGRPDVKEAFDTLAATCKACHQTFRVKK